ncbi:MAG TPA: phage portal protein [Actinomycetota bacterium]|nr:phage portal protein [Actinomycetota bacterium]
MTEIYEPGHPLWWVRRLEERLASRRGHLERYAHYYAGDHDLQFATEKFREAFGGLFRHFADNWCDLVVDAVEERLNVDGFRLGDDPAGDKGAWEIWQRNQLDADSQIAHTEALVHGISYALVWWGEDRRPAVNVESPFQTVVAFETGSRRRRAAALKKWRDDQGYELVTLYLPQEIYKWRGRHRVSDGPQVGSVDPMRLVEREVADEPWPLPNPLGVVPVVPLVNKPTLGAEAGQSEIHKVIPIQNAVNKLTADLLVASEYAAFRQRWATGLEIPRDPETNQQIEPFRSAVSRLWISEDPETSFGEFGETNLENYVKAIEMLVQHIASQTRTPPHYFFLRGQFPSGESIKAAETGLVTKARRKMRHFGEGWEEVMRLALRVAGDERGAQAWGMETIWADPESRTESQHVDAILKKLQLGVPQQQLWEDAGYTPQQIERFHAMRRREALEASTAGGDLRRLFDADSEPAPVSPERLR